MIRQFRYLRSKLARRIVWLFIVCAIVPIGLLAVITVFSVSNTLEQDSIRRLNLAARNEGMTILERLVLLDTNLKLLSAHADKDHGKDLQAWLNSSNTHFTALTLSSSDGNAQPLVGRAVLPITLSAGQRSFLSSGHSLLWTRNCPGARSCVYLTRQWISDSGTVQYLTAELPAEFLWNSDDIPDSVDLCVFDSENQPIHCPRGVPSVNPVQNAGFFSWQQDGRSFPAVYWKLHLKSKFLMDHWTVAIADESNASIVALESFRRNLLLVTLLSLWVVLLLSLILIRRTLVPLDRLREGTKKLAQGDLQARVAVSSNDEFEELSNSFNLMSSRIESQLRSLQAAYEIDKAILSSWDLEKVAAELFMRLPGILSYDLAGITVLSHEENAEVNTYFAGQDGSLRSFNAQVDDFDLEAVRRSPDGFILRAGDIYPHFLLPLVSRGMRNFFALPIAGDSGPVAVLTFANSERCDWSDEDQHQARRVASQLAVALSNVSLVTQLKQLRWGTLTALARAIDAKSPWTAGHSERVTATAIKIGRELGLPSAELDILHAGGLLHDVGKIGVPAALLDKDGPLTPQERAQVQEHVLIGVRIVKPIPGFEQFVPIVREHHEWFDGSGYPYGISGKNISLHGRIFAVADVFDALISDRPYRRGMPLSKVISIIRNASGTQFDPHIVDVFFRVLQNEELDKAPPVAPEPALVRSEL